MPSARASRHSSSGRTWSGPSQSDPWWSGASPTGRSWSRKPWSTAAKGARACWELLLGSTHASRAVAGELAEARELLAYWEQRGRRLPPWALMRRREAREMARRWRARVRTAEELKYGRGLAGAASQLALERRMPTTVAQRGRQAVRVAAYTVAFTALALVLVFAAAVAVVTEVVLGAL